MLYSQSLIPTLKETPQEAESKSHRLMLRAALIRRLASGTYSYLPLGQRVLKKIEQVIREEMNRSGALEVLLPAIHPAELWKQSGRLDILGQDMIHFKDRHGKENVLGPTHEEVITDLVRKEVRSYRQLPLILYQIQTKFRDEARPRSGVIRSREFIMKDAYSFHAGESCLDKTYHLMRETYERIFKRCGLEYYIVQADPGAMGGSGSQEFVLFSDAGEDLVVQCGDSNEVVSVEMARRCLKGLKLSKAGTQKKYRRVPTPGHSSVEGVSHFLGKKPSDLVKTMIYETMDPSQSGSQQVFAVLVRGDHDVSDYKVRQLEIGKGAALATRQTIERSGSSFGFSGPLGLNMPLYIDEDVLGMKDFVVGANEDGCHLVDVNISDIVDEAGGQIVEPAGDFRMVIEGDSGPDGKTKLRLKTAIELGHIFKLNRRYSEPLGAYFRDEKGKEEPMLMGCYGIGVNRIMAAAIEQAADAKGIVWPSVEISPFEILLLPLNMNDEHVRRVALECHREMVKRGWDVLCDDREVTAGVKFNDAELIGIPLQVILGTKNLKNDEIEIRDRRERKSHVVKRESLWRDIEKLLDNLK